jgi:hypothetical protein
VKHRIAPYFSSFRIFVFLFAAVNATAQAILYRRTNLASNLPNVAKNVTPGLVNPGIFHPLAFHRSPPWRQRSSRWGSQSVDVVDTSTARKQTGAPLQSVSRPNLALFLAQQSSASQCGSRKERP